MKKTCLIVLLLGLLLIAGCAQTSTQASSGNQQPSVIEHTKEQTTEENPQQETTTQSTNKDIIEITSSGFNPVTLTINAGETVTFVNKDTQSHWVASAVHPTHLAYPKTGGCIGSKFDSCKGLMQDESFSFTFNNKGSWKYHDHLRPGLTGTIVVR